MRHAYEYVSMAPGGAGRIKIRIRIKIRKRIRRKIKSRSGI